MIECLDLSTGYPGSQISTGVTLGVKPGELLCLIGPNGCGKTTLLKTMAGLLPPKAGGVALEGRGLDTIPVRELARLRAYLPQLRESADLTVEALVSHGRFPYLGFSRQMSNQDRQWVDYAMEVTGITQWRGRRLKQLSGGQRQRVYLAMTVAQNTPLLLWDEPATYLDIGNRLAIMELAKQLNRRGKTIVMTLHDLSDALGVSDRVCLMDQGGNVRLTATPEQAFASEEVERVFGVCGQRVVLDTGAVTYVFTPERREKESFPYAREPRK